MAVGFSPSYGTPRVTPRDTAVKRIWKDGAYGTSGRWAPKVAVIERRAARHVADVLKGRR